MIDNLYQLQGNDSNVTVVLSNAVKLIVYITKNRQSRDHTNIK